MRTKLDIVFINWTICNLFLFVFVKSEETCEETPKCLNTFSENIGLDKSLILELIPIQNVAPAALDIICEERNTFVSCTESDIDSCSAMYKAFIQGIQDGFDKMCRLYRKGVLNYSGCLEVDTLRKWSKKCTNAMKRTLIINPEKQCSAINNWLQCAADGATNYCWKDAAEFLHNVQVAMITPMMDLISCPFDIVSYPTQEHGISLGCAQAILNRYPGLEDELTRQMKTMIKIDFDGIATNCRAHTCDTFTACTQTYRQPCDPVVRVLYEGMSDTYDYICTTGSQEYIEHVQCLSTYEVAEWERSCVKTMQNSISESSNSTCRSINVYLGCLKYGVSKNCKEKAAKFQDKINHLSVEPLGRELGCAIENIPYATGATGTGSFSATLTTLTVIVCTLILTL